MGGLSLFRKDCDKLSNTLKAVVIYQVNGTQTTFNFGFDYLRPSFVKVSVNGLQVYNYVLSGRQIDFDEAPIGTLRIERVTPTDQIVEWAPGSVLKATDMTTSQVQQLHIIEETSDSLIETSIVTDDNTGQWQGRGLRITNIADPIDAQDVTTKGYIEAVKTGFISVMTSTKDACLSALETAKTTALSAIDTLKNEVLGLIDTAKTNALSAITALKDSTISAMNTIKAEVDALKVTATEQAGIATTQAGIATEQAGIASDEADRAYAEANRAEAAADAIDMTSYYTKTEVDALVPDLATQAEAEAGTDNVKRMSPLRVAQYTTARIASQAEAEAGTDSVKIMTPLRVAQQTTARIASQAEAEAGTNTNKLMTPERSKQLVDVKTASPTEKLQTLGTLSANTTINCANGNIATATLGAAITIGITANASTSTCRVCTLILTNGGAYTITWNSAIKWAGGTAPTLTASGIDILHFITVNNGTSWLGCLGGKGFA